MLDRTTAPAVLPFGELSILPDTETVLKNGLTLHTLCAGNEDIARLDIVAEGGTADTATSYTALFAADILREGTSEHNGKEIADAIDYNGAWLNTAAAPHFTTLSLACLSNKLQTLTPLFTECFCMPSFPENAFEVIRKRGVARQELNFKRVSFLATAANRQLIMGPGHPESHIPTADEIKNIQRSEVMRFHGQILNARHTHAYLCGRFSDADLKFITAQLEQIPQSEAASPMHITHHKALPAQTSQVGMDDSMQCAVVLSIPSIPRSHPHFNALRLAVTALGGYFGSRLMMNIREDKGYTYGINASLCASYEGSYVNISAQCDPAYTADLVNEVRKELLRMVSEPLSPEEMHRLRFSAMSDLATILDSPITMMDYHQLQHIVGAPQNYFEARQAAINSVTPDELARMAALYLKPDELRISIAGPK